MPGNNGRRANAKANTRSGVGAPPPTPTEAGASLSSSSMVTATGPPSSSSSSFLELRHLQALRRSCAGRGRRRAAGVRRVLPGGWWRAAWRTASVARYHSTASYVPNAAYE